MAGDRNPDIDRRTFLKATGAAGTAAALGGVGGVASANESSQSDTYLVGYAADRSPEQVIRDLPDNVEVLRVNEHLQYIEVSIDENSVYAQVSTASSVQEVSSVKFFEENATFHTMETPDDPRFSDQYAPQLVGAPAAWDTTLGSRDVLIAIVDQGVQYDHPDLENQFGSNKGKDFVDDDDDPYPDDMQNEYHGTHVAGSASATTDNGTGIAGISNSTLISCRALSEQGSGSTADIADAIRWATDQGADLINMSLGGGGYTDTMKNAVSYAVNNGTLPICAAGNNGSSSVSYPARYNECVAVSAIDENENLASFSQYGDNLDVASPGVDILSCWAKPGAQYSRISGTSMACPNATGVAALGKAVNPDAGPNELRQLLKESAVDIGLSDRKQGAGRVSAKNIVGGGGGGGNEVPNASFDVTDTSVETGTEVTFDASASADPDGSIGSYQWNFGDGSTATGETARHTYSSAGDYTAQLTVTDDDGASATDSTTITVTAPGGGGGSCGDSRKTTTESGSLSNSGDADAYEYTAKLADPCKLTLNLSGDSGTDFDLYVTLDGRTPTTSDYDERSYNYGSDESIEVGEFSAGQTVGVLVDSYSGSGSYNLSITELGSGSGGGGGNEAPTADLAASSSTAPVGETITFDASGSSDPDGRIASYQWSFGDGASATGQTVSHAYSSAGDYAVTLTVTDDAGATDTARTTVTVESGGGGGSCGDNRETASADGRLRSSWDDAAYSYSTQTSDPCQVTLSLDGPSSADFDLYVTLDGRTPSPYDYDQRSATPDSDEQVVIEDVDSSTELGILVDAWSGRGSFTISATEIGK